MGHDITIPFQTFLYNFDFLKSYFNHWNIYDQTNHTVLPRVLYFFSNGKSFVALMLNFFISDTTKVIHLVHTYVLSNLFYFYFLKLIQNTPRHYV